MSEPDDQPAAQRSAGTVKGIATKSIPAFVAGEELADLADSDPRIVAMTADLASASRLADFAKRHPARFFDMGIAEKNMITAAAGLAATGHIPFVGTFASFAALLGFEQIRTDCAYPGMPVRILAHHSGMSMGYYGTSHHALEDLAAMRAVAALTVACAADANQLRAMLRASLELPGAVYLRLGRGRDPEVYSAVPAGFEFGRAVRLREGSDATIITTGSQLHPSLAAAELLAAGGCEVRVVDMHTVKPLDVPAVLAAASRDRRRHHGRGAQHHRRPRQCRRRGARRSPAGGPVPPARHRGRVRAHRAARRALRALPARRGGHRGRRAGDLLGAGGGGSATGREVTTRPCRYLMRRWVRA